MENGSIIMSVLLFFDTPQEVVRYIASLMNGMIRLTTLLIQWKKW